MVTINTDNKTCFICGKKYVWKHTKLTLASFFLRDICRSSYEMPCLRFNWIKGTPFICEKCLYERLSGKKGEWVNFPDTVIMEDTEEKV